MVPNKSTRRCTFGKTQPKVVCRSAGARQPRHVLVTAFDAAASVSGGSNGVHGTQRHHAHRDGAHQ